MGIVTMTIANAREGVERLREGVATLGNLRERSEVNTEEVVKVEASVARAVNTEEVVRGVVGGYFSSSSSEKVLGDMGVETMWFAVDETARRMRRREG